MSPSAHPFSPGDVIQTEPCGGYWGCAVVLSATPRTPEFHAQFHIGITPIVFRHQYEWNELNTSALSILEFERGVRVAPEDYIRRAEVCIGIYTARTRRSVRILGRVDPSAVYSLPLTFTVGDGTDGNFPLCGPLKKGIGGEAVVAWRRVHDAENLKRELSAARQQFERLEADRLAKQSAARRTRCGDA